MIKRIWLCVPFVISLVLVSAPQSFGQVELFGGYSYLHLSNSATNKGSSANGWEGSLSTKLIGPLGAELDFSNHYGLSPANVSGYVPEFTELYGPRFTLFSLPRIEPFVHALFGTVHGVGEVTVPPGAPSCIRGIACATGFATVRQSAFAMAFGGGINVKATHHIWIRLIQADYLRANFSGNPQNDTRISAGFLLRFGSW